MSIHPKVINTVSLEFSALARQKAVNSEKIISLGLGEPGFSTPDEIVNAAYEAMKTGATKYSSPFGITDLREKIAEKLSNDFRRNVNIENIIVTLGAKQALSLSLMAILEPEDEVIVISPSYVSFIPQVYLAEPNVRLKAFNLNKNDFGIDIFALRRMITSATKAVILNFPHNPTGRILDIELMRELVDIITDNGSYLISDEIYEKLNFSNVCWTSFGRFTELSEKLIVINGFSKAYSMTGWRIGYLYGDPALIKRISIIQQHLNTNIPPFIQKAAVCALNFKEEFYSIYNKQLRNNETRLRNLVKEFPSLKYFPSQGGLFSFVNISDYGMDSDRFCSELLNNTGVAITPGKIFGADWDDHVRVSLAPDECLFKQGMERFSEFLKNRI